MIRLHWENKHLQASVEEPRIMGIEWMPVSYSHAHPELDFPETHATALDMSGGWVNKLFLGDNAAVMRLLLTKNFSEDLLRHGGIKLIYIDPPFAADVRFYHSLKLHGGKTNTGIKTAAFSDVWKEGMPEYLSMMYHRLQLMHELLAEDGSIYVHCDWRVNAYLRVILDEIFGRENFQREIIWRIGWVSGFKTKTRNWIRNHDTILFYSKNRDHFIFNKLYFPYPPDYRRRDGRKPRGEGYPVEDTWNCSEMDRLDSIQIMSFSREKTGYATQKNEGLLHRIIRASSNPGDIVADFFCGSGTTPVAAQKLNRKWIAADSGTLAVHKTRQRLIRTIYAPESRSSNPQRWAVYRLQAPAAREEHIVLNDAVTLARGSFSYHIYRKKQALQVRLTGFHPGELRSGSDSRRKARISVIMENGKLIETDARSDPPRRKTIIENWWDWIDYWAVGLDSNHDDNPHGPPDGETKDITVQWFSVPSMPGNEIQRVSCWITSTQMEHRTLYITLTDVFGREFSERTLIT